MGYIVGRNSAPVVADTAGLKNGDAPLVVDAPSQSSEPAASEPAPRESVTPPEAPRPQPPAAAPAKPEPEPEPVRPSAKAAKTEAKGHPAAGQYYLQLAATSQH